MSENGFIPPFSGFSVNCDPDGGNCFFAVNVFKPVNDIYSIGFILNYIFTGRRDLLADGSRLGFIIQKCSTTNSADRYQTVKGIIEDMRKTECPVG